MSNYTVLGLAGKMGAGKTTLADELVKQGWVKLSFADGVRDLALTLDPIVEFGADYDEAWSERLAEVVSGIGWDAAKANPEVRRILQVVGTEIGRAIDPDIWVDKLFQQMYKLPSGSKIVVDDVRFPNECNYLRYKAHGQVVLLEGGHPAGSDHISETGVDSLNVTYRLGWMPVSERLEAVLSNLAVRA